MIDLLLDLNERYDVDLKPLTKLSSLALRGERDLSFPFVVVFRSLTRAHDRFAL